MLAADLIERLTDFAGADADSSAAVRKARRAIQDALREFPGLHRWQIHYTHGRIPLNALYNTGTVAYDSATRHLTLTGGTWPSWAASGWVRINDVVSAVSSRDSGTQLTLDSTVCPIADIAAGTGYVLFQDRYDLPADFLATDACLAEQRFGELQYVHPQAQEWMVRTAERSGFPQYYTFWPSKTPGRLALRVSPFPDAAQTVDFLYQRRMAAIAFDIVEAGTVSVSSGSAAVTGTGTAFRSGMVGSTIRFSRDNTRPTSMEGGNAAAFETTITAVNSLTSITLADNAPEDFSGVNYVISDRLDLDEGVMATAFCWQAMKHMAQGLQFKNMAAVQQQAIQYLLLAKEHDARNFSAETAGPGRLRRPTRRHMPTGPDVI